MGLITLNLVSRLNSDTQVVQDGLSTAVSMFVKSGCIILGILIVMCLYSVKLTVFAVLLIIPSMFSNRIFMEFFKKYNEEYQKAKGDLGSIAQETVSNVRTVKAFADEAGSIK